MGSPSQPDPIPDDLDALALETLMDQVLQRLSQQGSGCIEDLCAGRPQVAERVRALVVQLQAFGLTPDLELESADTKGRAALPREFGPFRLLQRLGGGGMGVVYLAEERALNRRVALKLIRPELLDTPRARVRFQREVEAASRLTHANLVTVFAAGETDGQPWVSMRWVEGASLEQSIAEARQVGPRAGRSHAPALPLQVALAVVEKIARALHLAHEAGLVHRDVKPGNISLGADGEPVLLDFGLVHLADGGATLTQTGDRLGTPAYMAPEQIDGRVGPLDHRADVYALGITLHELLTLHTPFAAESREQLYRAIVTGERKRIDFGRGQTSRDLRVVVETAIDPDPNRRYPSALALAEDLARVRTHRPITARRAGPIARTQRWCRRNPAPAGLIGVLVLGLGLSAALLVRGDRALRRSDAIGLANQAAVARQTSPLLSLQLALRAARMHPSAETMSELAESLRGAEEQLSGVAIPRRIGGVLAVGGNGLAVWSHGKPKEGPVAVLHQSEGWRELEHETNPYDMSVSPDGQWIVSAMRTSTLRLFNAQGDLQRVLTIESQAPNLRVPMARFFPDSRRFAVAASDGVLRIFDTSARLLHSIPVHTKGQRFMSALAMHPSGARVAVGGDRDRTSVVDVSSGEIQVLPIGERRLSAPSAIKHLQFGADGALAAVSNAYVVRLWNPGGALELETGGKDNPAHAALAPDGKTLVTVHLDQRVRVHDLVAGTMAVLEGHEGWIVGACFSPAARTFCTFGMDGIALVRDWQTLDVLQVLRGGQTSGIVAATYMDEDTLVVGTTTGAVRAFGLRAPDLADLRGHTVGAPACVAIAGDGDAALATGDASGMVRLFTMRGELVAAVRAGDGFVRAAEVSLDGRTTAWAMQGDVVGIDAGGRELARLRQPRPVRAIAFGRGDALLVVADAEAESSIVWHPRAAVGWGDARTIAGGALVYSVAYCPVLKRLYLGTGDGRVLRYDWSGADPTALPPQRIGDALVEFLVALPAGAGLATGDARGFVRVFDARGELVCSATVEGKVTGLDVSPQGDLLLVSGSGDLAQVLDRAGKHLLTLRPAGGKLGSIGFTRDGRRAFLASTSRVVRLHAVRWDELLEMAQLREERAVRDRPGIR